MHVFHQYFTRTFLNVVGMTALKQGFQSGLELNPQPSRYTVVCKGLDTPLRFYDKLLYLYKGRTQQQDFFSYKDVDVRNS